MVNAKSQMAANTSFIEMVELDLEQIKLSGMAYNTTCTFDLITNGFYKAEKISKI